jgi:hypothetical protein
VAIYVPSILDVLLQVVEAFQPSGDHDQVIALGGKQLAK